MTLTVETGSARLRRRLSLVIAAAVLVAAPLAPGLLADGSATAPIRLPAESMVVLLLAVVLPWHHARVVWKDPAKVQQAYTQSVRYSLGAMFSFLHESDDPMRAFHDRFLAAFSPKG